MGKIKDVTKLCRNFNWKQAGPRIIPERLHYNRIVRPNRLCLSAVWRADTILKWECISVWQEAAFKRVKEQVRDPSFPLTQTIKLENGRNKKRSHRDMGKSY